MSSTRGTQPSTASRAGASANPSYARLTQSSVFQKCRHLLSKPSGALRSDTRAPTTGSSRFNLAATGASTARRKPPASDASGASAKSRKPVGHGTLQSVETKTAAGEEGAHAKKRDLPDSSFAPDTLDKSSSASRSSTGSETRMSLNGKDPYANLQSTLFNSNDQDAPPERVPRRKAYDKTPTRTLTGSQSSAGGKRETKTGGEKRQKKTEGTRQSGNTRTTGASAKSSKPSGVTKRRKPAKPRKRGRREMPPGWSGDSNGSAD